VKHQFFPIGHGRNELGYLDEEVRLALIERLSVPFESMPTSPYQRSNPAFDDSGLFPDFALKARLDVFTVFYPATGRDPKGAA
jgi:hypothetical protein